MNTFKVLIVVLIGYGVTYMYGVASTRYELFPYNVLSGLILSDEVLTPSKTHGAKGPALYEKLQQGGYIIYFRHNHREKAQDTRLFDALAHLTETEIVHPTYKDGLCLSEYGEKQNWYLSRVFSALALPIGKVISSPICRCVQTAEGIFGRVDELDYDMIYKTILPQDKIDEIYARRREALEQLPAAGTNTVVVAHSSPSLHAVGLNVPELVEGGAVVLKPEENGEIHFVTMLKPRDWIHLLEQKPISEAESLTQVL